MQLSLLLCSLKAAIRKGTKELAASAVREHDSMVTKMQLAKALRDQGFEAPHIEKAFQIVGSADPQAAYDWLKSHYPRAQDRAPTAPEPPKTRKQSRAKVRVDLFARHASSGEQVIELTDTALSASKRNPSEGSGKVAWATPSKTGDGDMGMDLEAGVAADTDDSTKTQNDGRVVVKKSKRKKKLKPAANLDELAERLTLCGRIQSGLLYLWLSLTLAQAQKANKRERFQGGEEAFTTARQFKFDFKSGHNQGPDAERVWGVRPIPYLAIILCLVLFKSFADIGPFVIVAWLRLADSEDAEATAAITAPVLAFAIFWLVVALVVIVVAAYAVGVVHLRQNAFE